MHKLNISIEVNENDDDIEQEICIKLRDIFVTAVDLLDYSASHFAQSHIERVLE